MPAGGSSEIKVNEDKNEEDKGDETEVEMPWERLTRGCNSGHLEEKERL